MSRLCALISVLLLPSLALAELTGSPSGEAAAAGSDSTLVAEPIIHQNSRCLCKCPDVSTVREDWAAWKKNVGDPARRSVYINSTVPPDDCDCPHVVLPYIREPPLTESQADAFCPRCKCKYELRNLTVMKVVVILVIWVIGLLVIYMAFLACLEPVLNRRKMLPSHAPAAAGYNEHHDEEDLEEDMQGGTEHGAPSGGSHAMRSYGSSVINRMGDQQVRWKRQVIEQRRNIYDRHSMLN